MPAQQVGGGQRLEGGHVAAARQHDVGLAAGRDDGDRPSPTRRPGPAVVDRRVHASQLGISFLPATTTFT